MSRLFSIFITLLIFWLLLSGLFTPFLIGAGVCSALVIALFARRLGLVDHEGHPLYLAWPALISYWPWLLKEILKSGWDVAMRILDPRLPISPVMVEFQPTQKTGMGLVIHGNSITLTPGTVTIEAAPGRFLVHALTQEGAAGLADSEMDRRCSALERG